MKKVYVLAAGLVLLAAACEKNEAEQIRFVQISPLITRATDTNFEDGDKIGLTITQESGGYAENQELTFADGVFTGTLKWYSESLTESTLTAYYPYVSTGTPSKFSVQADQSEGISSSDFIAGVKENVTPTSEAVTVPFKHLLTKLVLKVDNQAGADITAVTLEGAKPTADIDLSTLTAKVDTTSEEITVKACEVSADSEYALIVVPQTVALRLAVTLSTGDVLSQKLLSTKLHAGGQYTINAKVLPDDLSVSISGEIANWEDGGEIAPDVPTYIDFAEYDGYFIYKNEKYTTVTFSDGSVWMSQPMRYVPDGYTVSTDPAATDVHIWAPYTIVDGTATASSDETVIARQGYLYDCQAIFGQEVTKDNASTFEGAQGICPNGWHVPTRAEYIALCGYSNKADGETEAVTDTTALFWDADAKYGSIKQANALGWNFVLTGNRMKSNYSAAGKYLNTAITEAKTNDQTLVGQPAITYCATSTLYKYNDTTSPSLQFFALGTTFNTTYPDGRLLLMYAHCECGMQLRCVKNK